MLEDYRPGRPNAMSDSSDIRRLQEAGLEGIEYNPVKAAIEVGQELAKIVLEKIRRKPPLAPVH
jgi:hypothetical protein